MCCSLPQPYPHCLSKEVLLTFGYMHSLHRLVVLLTNVSEYFCGSLMYQIHKSILFILGLILIPATEFFRNQTLCIASVIAHQLTAMLTDGNCGVRFHSSVIGVALKCAFCTIPQPVFMLV